MDNNFNDEDFLDENSYEVRLEKSKNILNMFTKPVMAGLMQGFWDCFYCNGFCIEKVYNWTVIGKDTLFYGTSQFLAYSIYHYSGIDSMLYDNSLLKLTSMSVIGWYVYQYIFYRPLLMNDKGIKNPKKAYRGGIHNFITVFVINSILEWSRVENALLSLTEKIKIPQSVKNLDVSNRVNKMLLYIRENVSKKIIEFNVIDDDDKNNNSLAVSTVSTVLNLEDDMQYMANINSTTFMSLYNPNTLASLGKDFKTRYTNTKKYFTLVLWEFVSMSLLFFQYM